MPGSDTYEFPPEEEHFQVNEAELLRQIDRRQVKRQNAVGFLAVAAIILLMLGAMMGISPVVFGPLTFHRSKILRGYE